ncbi:MAG: hypothetical protein HY908_33435 [Myxococcales bacterium]|nr:hypothetical protein [Myxococcales bacterium]
MSTPSRLRLAWLGAIVSAAALTPLGCVAPNHPLAEGLLEVIVDDVPLFAADLLDDAGLPVLPRQEPYEKVVQLRMSDHTGKDADRGAFVDVRLDPPGSLELVAVDETCEYLSGTFRCTAQEDGYARFLLRSMSDWSGSVDIRFDGREDSKPVEVSAAGLPPGASSFEFIVGGVDGNLNTVGATYAQLKCATGPVPSIAEDKWPAGKIRAREVTVRALPPAKAPGTIKNAPVVVQSLDPEAALSNSVDCAVRVSRLRVLLDEVGESPKFYFCFSDLGGDAVRFAALSGADTTERELRVAAEPRLFRLVTTAPSLGPFEQGQQVAELSAYDAEFRPVQMRVDVASTDLTVLSPQPASVTTSSDEQQPVVAITVNSGPSGSARVRVTPELRATPACETSLITIQ